MGIDHHHLQRKKSLKKKKKNHKRIFINMNVNIEIYLRKLKEFFNDDSDVRDDMFNKLDVDMEEFFNLIRKQAEINVDTDGEPMLSAEQMADIMAIIMSKEEMEVHKELKDIDLKNIFKTFVDGFPPICMN